MYKVYIADDEDVVRQGLKKIINWQELGFEICGEAANGETAYNEIMELTPNLIMLDIRMPKLHGIELAKKLRENKYDGSIIILSGYSEFKYAQDAIRCDVDFYLTKPIDEEELYSAVQSIKEKTNKKHKASQHFSYYQSKAKDKILEDIIQGINFNLENAQYSIDELGLNENKYMILILKAIDEDFNVFNCLCNALKIPPDDSGIKNIIIDSNQVVLLKGKMIISRFLSYRDKATETDSPTFFIANGRQATSVKEISASYEDALNVFNNQFFFDLNKHIAHTKDITNPEYPAYTFSAKSSKELGHQLYDLIVVFKKSECDAFLDNLKVQIIHSNNSVESIKSVLAGMYIFIVQEFKKTYANYNPEFLTNAEIIQWFHCCSYLDELLDFIKVESNRLIQIIGGYSSESIVDEIVKFMKYHYNEDIKLKNIAPKFGYNSSYLGKIFAKKMNDSFNDYLHKIRAEKAKKLLLNKKYKIYEISSLIGYKNVDYFHLKFKQFEGCTPNEYRTANRIDTE